MQGTAEAHSRVTVLNGGTFTATTDVDAAGTWQLVYLLHGGWNTLTARATDRAGHNSPSSAAVTVRVVVDPPLDDVGAEPMLANGSSELRLWATSRDADHPAGPATTAVTATLPGGTTASLSYRQALSGSLGLWDATRTGDAGMMHGSNRILFEGIDAVGLSGQGATAIWVDRDPPDIPLVRGPLGHIYTTQDSINVYGEAGGHDTILVFVNGVSAGTTQANANGWWTFQLDLVEGDQIITVRARDGAGNESGPSAAVRVTRDTTPPQIAGQVWPSFVRAGHELTVTTIVSDAGEIEWVRVDVQGSTSYHLGQGSGRHEYTLLLPANLSEGWKNAVFAARDAAGHTGVLTVTFLVDNTPPDAMLNIVKDSPYAHVADHTAYYGASSGTFTLTLTAADPDPSAGSGQAAGLGEIVFPATVSAGASYSQDGALTATVTHVYTFANGDGANGTYTITVTDRATNQTTAPFTVTRDIIVPTVTLTVPERIAASDIPVQWTATDPSAGSGQAGSGIRGYDLEVSADGGASWTRLLTETQDTSYTFTGALGVAYTFPSPDSGQAVSTRRTM